MKKSVEDLKFFREKRQELQTDDYDKLVTKFDVEKMSKYDVVFNFGESGYKYFIILKGSVCILTPLNNTEENKDGNS